jgi:shikimate 5-dehydrogenase
MIGFALVLATQALDALGLLLALGHGQEANPLMLALLGAGGFGAVLAAKLAGGVALGAVAARRVPRAVPWLALVGCIGCLSELLVV